MGHGHILCTIKSRTHNRLLPKVNGHTTNPKNRQKDLKGVLEFKFTMLQKQLKILPSKCATKWISLHQCYNQGIVKHINKYHSYQAPQSRARLLCIYIS